jgi:hypothetical protein
METSSNHIKIKQQKTIWRWWAKALGEKASKCDKESDTVAIIRTVIFATYLITNCFIVAGVIRHWNRDGQFQNCPTSYSISSEKQVS